MKNRKARRRLEVNLDELDRIIDQGTRSPLSHADSQKRKAALDAMANRLTQKRSTEKTSAVLRELNPASTPPSFDSTDKAEAAPGHGRNGAAAFSGAIRVSIPHATLRPGHARPECDAVKVYQQKEPATLLRIVGHALLQATVFEMERPRCNACGRIFRAAGPESRDGHSATDYGDFTAIRLR